MLPRSIGSFLRQPARVALVVALSIGCHSSTPPRRGGSGGAGEAGGSGGDPGGAGGAAGAGGGGTGGVGGSAPADAAPAPDRAAPVDAAPPLDSAAPTGDAAPRPPGMFPPVAPDVGGPIGTGWTEVFPTFKADQPPGQVRYEINNGEFHFWLFNTDMSTYPGRDSGPRSELRIHHDWSTGQAQFQADIKIVAGCTRASVMQVFGGASSATSFMAFVVNNGLHHYSNELIFSPVYDTYLRLNVLHDTATGNVDVYVNNAKRATFKDHGAATHYFKAGIYHQTGMSARCDIYFKNFRFFSK